MTYAVEKTDEQWRDELTPSEYAVLREAATERAWTGELLDEDRAGLYTCGACGAELFKSGTKFDSRLRLAELLRVGPTRGRRAHRGQHRSAWCAPRCAARTAARTSATSSTTDSARRPATATA